MEWETPEFGAKKPLAGVRVSGSLHMTIQTAVLIETLAEEIAAKLGEEYDCALINPRFTKPIDQATTEYFAKTADSIVTLEDHVLAGGYGSIVAELLIEKGIHTPLTRVGWPDQFIEHASSVGELREKYGLTPKAITAQIESASVTKASSKAKAVA